MAFSGSPVLSDEKFGEQTREAQSAAPMGPGAPTSYSVMTVGGTVTAGIVLMILLVGSAAYGWTLVEPGEVVTTVNRATGEVSESYNVTIPPWIWLCGLAAIGVGLVTAFVPKIARFTAPLYCLLYGVLIGAISAMYNNFYDGIVAQAAFATLGIFAAMLLLYVTRVIKVTNKFVMVVAAATLGIFLMYMLAWVVSLIGGADSVSFLYEPSPLSIGISVVIIIVAALNLAVDFAFIEKASMHQVPKYMEWYAAWGLVVTLIWIYLEVLRLLAILNRN